MNQENVLVKETEQEVQSEVNEEINATEKQLEEEAEHQTDETNNDAETNLEESTPIENEEDEPIESDTPAKTFDPSSFVSSSSHGKAGRTGEAGVFSIVKSNKNGNRITMSPKCWGKLNKAKQLQFAFNDNQIAIAEELPDNEHYFHVRTYGAKGVIYSKDLVEEITELFALDFSDKVSITLYEVEYVKNGDHTVAIITVDQE